MQLFKGANIINTRLHGMLDYLSALILLLPWITGYYETGKDSMALSLVGAATLIYSLMTDYEFGLIKIVPMKVHLVLDILNALFLISMPWIIPVAHFQYHWPTLFGVVELLIVLLSGTQPYRVNRQETQIGKP